MPSVLLRDCEPELAHGYVLGKSDYEAAHPGKSTQVTCTYRSAEEQQVLYAQGRTKPGAIVTYIDGVTKKSNHNFSPARALDFCVVISGKVSWEPMEYATAAPYFKAQGLHWGGDWPHFKDYPHLEL